jgi:tetratricopeptide (TPR) repeat protein
LANAPIEPIPAALDTCRAQLPKLGDGRHPNWALNALGNSQLRAHQPLKAANLYRTALSAVPASGREFAILSTNLALALGDTDPSKAIDWLKKACAADPSFAEARVNLALALLRQHTDSAPQSSAAEAHLNKALGILSAEQGPEAAHVKARIHLYLGNLLSDRAYTKDAGESNGVKSVQHPIASLDVEGMDARLAECQTYDCILDLSKMGSPSKPPTLQTGARSPSNPVGTVENGALVLPRQDRFVRPEDWNVQHERLSRTRFAAKA